MYSRLVLCAMFTAALFALPERARAQGMDLGSVNYGTPASGGTLVGGQITVRNPVGFSRVVAAAPTLGDVVITDGIRTRVGAADVNMALSRRIPWSQVARGAAAIGRTIPYVATGVAFIELMDTLRLRSNGDGWLQDPGTEQVSGTGVCYGNDPACYATATDFLAGTGFGCGEGRPVRAVDGPRGNLWHIQILLPSGAWQYCYYDLSIPSRTVTTRACPASIDALNPANSIPAGASPGYDGKCRTGRYTVPRTETAAGDIVTANGPKAVAAGALESLMGRGVDLAPRTDTPTASGPSAVPFPGTTTTTTGPGGTTTGTTAPGAVITYNGPSYTWNDTTVTVTNSPGGSTTTTTTAPPPEIKTCGLPGTPACKIDETGTPVAPDKDPPTDVDGKTIEVRDGITNPTAKWGPFPTISWSFSLPTACGPIAIPAFSPWLTSIDICPFQAIFHNIMSMVWIVGGLFGAIGVFWRDQLATP